jgi:hypothetical protein
MPVADCVCIPTEQPTQKRSEAGVATVADAPDIRAEFPRCEATHMHYETSPGQSEYCGSQCVLDDLARPHKCGRGHEF